jgi:predicted DNA-binding protein
MSTPKQLVSARVSQETLEKIEEMAEALRRSKSWIVADALENEVARQYRVLEYQKIVGKEKGKGKAKAKAKKKAE